MLYNDETTKTGICQEIDEICGSNTTSYTLASKNRRLNSALDDFLLICLKEAGGWSVEDTGNTTFAIATRALTSGQADYAFPTELLVIEMIEMLQSDGVTWVEIKPIDKIPLNQASAQPTSYKKVGNSFILSATPNYTVAGGIKVHYRRAFTYSTLSGTTFTPTSPGIPSIFHTWLARKAALPYLIDKGVKNKADIFTLVEGGKADIISYFGQKSRDVPHGMRTSSQRGANSCR